MAVLAVLAVIAGVVYLPFGITDWLGDFLEPTFADSIVAAPRNDGLEAFGLVLTSVIAVVFIAFAYRIWAAAGAVGAPGRSASRRCTGCSSTSGTSTS